MARQSRRSLRPKLKARYEDLCLQEEIKWKQRSRVHWLKHLFSFFYNQLGVTQDPSAKIDLHAAYCDETFDLSGLQSPFTLPEVKRAVFSSAPEKAPGPDGLPMLFYQRFWNLLKDDIMSVFNCFYNGTANLDLINTMWLCLIPKKKESLFANDFRPISLVHSMAKLISKVLASRLQIFLHDLINPYQAAFIKGRHIFDNFNCAHILIHHLHTAKARAALLKIDFERAFDRINWHFLFDLLQARGFTPRWISWIQALLQTASTAVILNGTPGKRFTRSALSPTLYLMHRCFVQVAPEGNDNTPTTRSWDRKRKTAHTPICG
ncbi:Transposon TX1 uncharacterized 149 kDa protein [Ananas comosus]|uniref:Transposon TX1 uncharacterized 149 kDa protein n=1 Tax=Ananas comosus TaxID=4615 RepID=A0A199VTT4_ANACO|nr:Transposon TX1 uncharacterized 149 kDa protein [Ananas comosus]